MNLFRLYDLPKEVDELKEKFEWLHDKFDDLNQELNILRNDFDGHDHKNEEPIPFLGYGTEEGGEK